ncbi:hypothetical protein [Arthrobacter sp. 35W]|uniref:hypothetical protein n=1 Tax=Arthrobacter sp. 35W TaxID=1132441 RepID=UPI00041E4B6E|nr:hypothetical protein [Arthrobacter sp. 35W]
MPPDGPEQPLHGQGHQPPGHPADPRQGHHESSGLPRRRNRRRIGWAVATGLLFLVLVAVGLAALSQILGGMGAPAVP